jgi:hypothetical protein
MDQINAFSRKLPTPDLIQYANKLFITLSEYFGELDGVLE